MYVRFIHHHPALGKGPELRSVIEELVKARNAKGGRNALYMTMLTEEPDYVHAVAHDDFAAWEAHLAGNLSDKDMQTYASKMQTLVSRFPVQEIHDVIARERSDKPVNFVWANSFVPVRGAIAELRKLLEERVATSVQRGSSGATLLQRLYGPDGPTFSLNIAMPDLASLESYTRAMQGDPETQKWGTALSKVTDGTGRPLLVRALVAPPA